MKLLLIVPAETDGLGDLTVRAACRQFQFLMMENLSISDPPHPPPPSHGPGGVPSPVLGRPPQPQQLPAQMFTTAAQLLDLTDSKANIYLRSVPRMTSSADTISHS